MPLTDSQIRSFKPSSKRMRRSDGHGLFLEVMPSGKKVFRLAYRIHGEQRTTLIGDYPETRLADARLKVAEIKRAVRDGIDPRPPAPAKPAKSNAPSWKELADDYLMLRQRSGAAPATIKKLTYQLAATVEALGDRPIDEIAAEDILAVVNPIAERGRVESAHEIRTRCSQVFRYAGARGLIKHDPAAMIVDAMIKRPRGGFAAITDPAEVGELMRQLRAYHQDNLIVGTALLLSAYLFPRNAELRGMRWDEIDWEQKLWDIPAARMKMKREHLVPLPKQALTLLKDLRQYDLGSHLVFPSPQDLRRMLSDMAFNAGLRRLGYTGDRHVHHGFRTTASTNLNELGWNADWIERQLAHVPVNKVRASYNRAQFLDGRTEMMQAYADWLDTQAQKNGDDHSGVR